MPNSAQRQAFSVLQRPKVVLMIQQCLWYGQNIKILQKYFEIFLKYFMNLLLRCSRRQKWSKIFCKHLKIFLKYFKISLKYFENISMPQVSVDHENHICFWNNSKPGLQPGLFEFWIFQIFSKYFEIFSKYFDAIGLSRLWEPL